MFAPTSRYASAETATHVLPDGRAVRYVRRIRDYGDIIRHLTRELPAPAASTAVALNGY